MKNVPELFGSMVFNDSVMKERLSKEVYKSLRKTIQTGSHLIDIGVANSVANSMKNWACEQGVTHFTHWFQPMTGITAEKHDSFISIPDSHGKILMEFSGKSLVKGEPDASSFPSGGLRATFEARGYTAWDPTSYAFIKDNTLCIPTAFCSYDGNALDKKTPLLRSMEAVSKQALRVIRAMGDTTAQRVVPQVGPEQEYFLIDKEVALQRPDIIHTGRTLFGARPSKGQEMDDHYFGAIKPRVANFMAELDEELWKLGILSKTKHNEVAPAQHELAPIFSTVNISTDHNQLTMELMKTVASRNGLVCLLHEKPFAGVNGSGKHNNWSLSTDTGINLLEPGDTPHENAQFLLFLIAVIKAVDIHQDLLRISVASAGNDHRLGANEAPPAVVSIFLGDELTEILNALETDTLYVGKEKVHMEIGTTALPHIPKDTTDRNRTSPFAFTGNKFEFRMLGSAFSISGPNIILNTAMADILDEFATRLEKSSDVDGELETIIKETLKQHKRIIFNGNGYDESWIEQAEQLGLLNLKTTPQALPHFVDKKNVDLFTKHAVFSETETHSRLEIMLEGYNKTINIEALTMIDMVNAHIIPAVIACQKDLADLAVAKRTLSIHHVDSLEAQMLDKIANLSDCMYKRLGALSEKAMKAKDIENQEEAANFYYDKVKVAMDELRTTVDELETIVGKKYWTLPTYSDILYSVN